MPASFYNDLTAILGVDKHPIQILSLNPLKAHSGEEVNAWPFLVAVPCRWPGGDESKRTGTVTADGEKMIRDGFIIGKVPHIPAPAPFHPYQVVKSAKIIKDSKTRHLMKIESVTSEGDALAVCLVGPVGVNLNCQEAGQGDENNEKMTGLALSSCTALTQPSYKDFVFRVFDDFIKEWFVDKLLQVIDLLLKLARIGAIPRAIVNWIAKRVVPVLVDMAEETAKWLWDVVERGQRARSAALASALPALLR